MTYNHTHINIHHTEKIQQIHLIQQIYLRQHIHIQHIRQHKQYIHIHMQIHINFYIADIMSWQDISYIIDIMFGQLFMVLRTN